MCFSVGDITSEGSKLFYQSNADNFAPIATFESTLKQPSSDANVQVSGEYDGIMEQLGEIYLMKGTINGIEAPAF